MNAATIKYIYNQLNPPNEFKFSDDVMFTLVMQDREIFREVVESILDTEIGIIKNLVSQRTIVNNPQMKYIRLDACAETADGTIYDIEIQMNKHKGLEQRMRYYQSMLDSNTTKLGKSYEELPNSYIIFICDFDYFGLNEPIYAPIYFFPDLCDNGMGLKFNDGTRKIIINASAYKKVKNPKLRNLLRYIKTNEATDELTRRIDKMVKSTAYQQSALEGFFQFSTIEQDMRRESFEDGLHQKACDIAKIALSMKLPIEQISTMTGLSEDEILELSD